MKELKCPHCQNDDESLMEKQLETAAFIIYSCSVCSKIFSIKKESTSA